MPFSSAACRLTPENHTGVELLCQHMALNTSFSTGDNSRYKRGNCSADLGSPKPYPTWGQL